MTFLSEALTYLSSGWGVYPAHSVNLETGLCSCGKLNCSCPGKHPVGRWLEYQDRMPTRNEVKLWFRSLDCNIGTITGRVSGLVVIDIDGQEGLKSMKLLTLAPTLTARTGSGGLHLFYAIPKDSDPVSSRVGVLKGIDIRADGGFIVLAPSMHKSGRAYRWVRTSNMAPFDRNAFDSFSRNNYNHYRTDEWASEALQGVSEGERSTTAARLAGRYAFLGLSPSEIMILLSEWNRRNEPPLLDYDLEKTVRAIVRKHYSQTPVEINSLGEIRDILQINQIIKFKGE